MTSYFTKIKNLQFFRNLTNFPLFHSFQNVLILTQIGRNIHNVLYKLEFSLIFSFNTTFGNSSTIVLAILFAKH